MFSCHSCARAHVCVCVVHVWLLFLGSSHCNNCKTLCNTIEFKVNFHWVHLSKNSLPLLRGETYTRTHILDIFQPNAFKTHSLLSSRMFTFFGHFRPILKHSLWWLSCHTSYLFRKLLSKASTLFRHTQAFALTDSELAISAFVLTLCFLPVGSLLLMALEN